MIAWQITVRKNGVFVFCTPWDPDKRKVVAAASSINCAYSHQAGVTIVISERTATVRHGTMHDILGVV